jgi:hypothetical protein
MKLEFISIPHICLAQVLPILSTASIYIEAVLRIGTTCQIGVSFFKLLIQSQECMKLESITIPHICLAHRSCAKNRNHLSNSDFPCTSIDVSVHYAKCMCCSEICIDFSTYRNILYKYVWGFGMHMSGWNVGLLYQSRPTTNFSVLSNKLLLPLWQNRNYKKKTSISTFNFPFVSEQSPITTLAKWQ